MSYTRHLLDLATQSLRLVSDQEAMYEYNGKMYHNHHDWDEDCDDRQQDIWDRAGDLQADLDEAQQAETVRIPLALVESPFAGDTQERRDVHALYARLAMRDCLYMGFAPFASHALYTLPDVLDDDKPAERRRGIAAGLAWGRVADMTIVYSDLGISPGMCQGMEDALEHGREIRHRDLWPDKNEAEVYAYLMGLLGGAS